MRYVARRFIDLYRPGDEIDPARYDAAMLVKMLRQGKVRAVGGAGVTEETPAALAPAPETKRKQPRKGAL